MIDRTLRAVMSGIGRDSRLVSRAVGPAGGEGGEPLRSLINLSFFFDGRRVSSSAHVDWQ